MSLIKAELLGSNTATACGVTAHASAPILNLCRALLHAGHDPGASLRAYRRGVMCLQVKTLAAGATLAVADDRFGCPKLRRWKAPLGDVRPPPVELAGNSEPLQPSIGDSAPARQEIPA